MGLHENLVKCFFPKSLYINISIYTHSMDLCNHQCYLLTPKACHLIKCSFISFLFICFKRQFRHLVWGGVMSIVNLHCICIFVVFAWAGLWNIIKAVNNTKSWMTRCYDYSLLLSTASLNEIISFCTKMIKTGNGMTNQAITTKNTMQ